MRRIDADALVKKLETVELEPTNPDAQASVIVASFGNRVIKRIIDAIENEPTIEPPARRSGKWLHPSGDTDAPYKCSICGVKSNTPFEECPNCWSRMEKIEQYTPRVGRWEDAYCGIYVATEYTCSLCGHTVLDAGNEIEKCGYKYCPHCGRKMANDKD